MVDQINLVFADDSLYDSLSEIMELCIRTWGKCIHYLAVCSLNIFLPLIRTAGRETLHSLFPQGEFHMKYSIQLSVMTFLSPQNVPKNKVVFNLSLYTGSFFLSPFQITSLVRLGLARLAYLRRMGPVSYYPS